MAVGMSLDWRDIERVAATHLGFFHVGLGCTIIAGGVVRFQAPTYGTLLDLTHGRVWPYGIVFILIGFLLAIPNTRVMFVAHWAGLIALNIFAALFFVAMLKNNEAASTAWWTYFFVGTIHGFNLALMMARRKQHLYPELEKSGRRGGD